MTRAKVYASVWDALADTPEQAANLRARAELMQQIAAIVKKEALDTNRGRATLWNHPAAYE
jgi:predicted XRE-type DNA-binding protein